MIVFIQHCSSQAKKLEYHALQYGENFKLRKFSFRQKYSQLCNITISVSEPVILISLINPVHPVCVIKLCISPFIFFSSFKINILFQLTSATVSLVCSILMYITNFFLNTNDYWGQNLSLVLVVSKIFRRRDPQHLTSPWLRINSQQTSPPRIAFKLSTGSSVHYWEVRTIISILLHLTGLLRK